MRQKVINQKDHSDNKHRGRQRRSHGPWSPCSLRWLHRKMVAI